MKDKSNLILGLSIVAIIISIFAIAFAVRGYQYADTDIPSFLVSVLSLLVTVLIGWNIYTVIDTKEELKKYDLKLRDIELNSVAGLTLLNAQNYYNLKDYSTSFEGSIKALDQYYKMSRNSELNFLNCLNLIWNIKQIDSIQSIKKINKDRCLKILNDLAIKIEYENLSEIINWIENLQTTKHNER